MKELQTCQPSSIEKASVGIVLEDNSIWKYDKFDNSWIIFSSETSKLEESILERFGAKGDGRTSDKESFEKAIKYSIENEKTIYLNNKTYNIENLSSSIRGKIRIEGPGTLKGTSTLFNIEDKGCIELKNLDFMGFRYVINLTHQKKLYDQVQFNVDNVKAVNIGAFIYSANKLMSTGNHIVKNSSVTNSTFENIRKGFALRINLSSCENLNISNNRISQIKGSEYGVGILVGEGSIKGSGTFKNINISDNTLYNIEGSKEAVGIQVIGVQNAVISNNTIDSVYTNSQLDADVEGIYTKCLNCSISGNTLLNAGGFEAAIMIKGRIKDDNRSEDGNAKGCNISVFNNVIKFDKEFINRYKQKVNITGIAATTESVILSNNIIEGVERGIVLRGVNGNNKIGNGYIISNNLITSSFANDNKSLGAGIEVASVSFKNISIDNNMILNARKNFNEYYGVYINDCKYLENLKITENTVSGVDKAINNKRGVFVSSKNDINHIIISNNYLSGLDFGISFSSKKEIEVQAVINNNHFVGIKKKKYFRK